MCAVEAFIGEGIYNFVERNLGIDWRILLEEKRITPYIQKLIDNSKYLGFQLNGRTEIEAISQLIYSRCIELRLIQKWDGKVKLNGTDRELLITEYSSYRPDCREVDCDYYYEIISTYNGQFILNHFLYVREEKIKFLCDFAKSHHIFIVCVDVLSKKYCFVPVKQDLEDMDNASTLPFNGVQVDLSTVDWFSLDESDLIVDMEG